MSDKAFIHSWWSLSRERRVASLGLGLAATILLFLAMQALIQSDQDPLNEAPTGQLLEFVRLIPDRPIDPPKRVEDPPDVVDPPPPLRVPPLDPTREHATFAITVPEDPVGPVNPAGSNLDGDKIVLLSVKPAYPNRALSRGIEGYVLVEFTVTETGAVLDPKVIEANPEGVFERAALNAIVRFKYKPRIVGGEAVAIEGVQNLFTFELEDG